MGNQRPIVYVTITNHGYGHATRMASVLREIAQRCPDVLLIVVTTAPRSILESYLGDIPFIQRPRALDVGVVQSDGLTMDLPATQQRLEDIRRRQHQIIAGEVNFIRLNRCQLVLGDIPPLAAPLARAAGVPGWMIGNFGWDFIYASWGDGFGPLVDWIRDCFSQCDRLFRLPFHEPMTAFPQVEDVGLTGGIPRYSPEELRERFSLQQPKERTVLLTFGGLGLNALPYDRLQDFPDWQFLSFDRQAPKHPNLITITDPQIRPVDLMPLCHCIVSKPGYGTFSEACRTGVPIISLTRQDFPESHLLLQGIQDHSHHRIITPPEFFQGPWSFLTQPLIPPQTQQSLPQNGNETIAEAVVNFLKG